MSIELTLGLWLLGVGLLAVELFVPGVIVGALGTLAVLGSIASMYINHGPLYGTGLAIASLISGGAIGVFAVRRIALREVLSTQKGYVATEDRSKLLGMTGVAATILRPGGFATIGGQRIDVVTNGEMLDKGTAVEVVAVEGNRVQVRTQVKT